MNGIDLWCKMIQDMGLDSILSYNFSVIVNKFRYGLMDYRRELIKELTKSLDADIAVEKYCTLITKVTNILHNLNKFVEECMK